MWLVAVSACAGTVLSRYQGEVIRQFALYFTIKLQYRHNSFMGQFNNVSPRPCIMLARTNHGAVTIDRVTSRVLPGEWGSISPK